MNFLQKNPLFQKLQDPSALGADSLLLQRKNPKAKALSFTSFDKAKMQKEILYELLDYATEEEIVNNRSGIIQKEPEGKSIAATKTVMVPTPEAEKKKSGGGSGKKSSNKKGRKRR